MKHTLPLPLLLLAILLIALTGLFLPSCAPGQSIPIRASIATPDGSIGYSSKAGLDVQVTVRPTK